MRIEQKLFLWNVFYVALIVLIGFFGYQNMNIVLTKLRFVEIADDLNASFLEMRLSEKNYFLYKDRTALADIEGKIHKTAVSIALVRNDIIRAIGDKNFTLLEGYLRKYADTVRDAEGGTPGDSQIEGRLRADGKKLKEFSEAITHIEREGVNEIIGNSETVLFYSFLMILVSAIVVSHFIAQRIVRSLRVIERLAKSISEGNFQRIEGTVVNDELGSAIEAMHSMSEELSNREEQLIQSKKLASLGVLTAGVAHELTNPLNNISMIAQTYLELYDTLSREDRMTFMDRIEGEAERIKEIVKNLLDFSKPKEANLKKSDINGVIQKTYTIVKNILDVSNIDAKLTLAEGLPLVLLDEHQIQQVLVNLVTNAVQAMSAGGRLFISSRLGKNGDSVEVTVMDTGKGIPPELLPHVFDPFFSTKGEGGTGLGLSVSYGIIKSHKGNIRVESKTGVGSTFTIELPI